ncbi:unnamed protein product [Protopolystoma xenopodis]|uniref:Uncharacterized protein n=1 Tax=Protopolystoma xenopodis TaxID=117903 RepID=A0A448WWC3_9PLAT|nr:unnamed protein product [Protopolystoma xenopodis]
MIQSCLLEAKLSTGSIILPHCKQAAIWYSPEPGPELSWPISQNPAIAECLASITTVPSRLTDQPIIASTGTYPHASFLLLLLLLPLLLFLLISNFPANTDGADRASLNSRLNPSLGEAHQRRSLAHLKSYVT